MIKVVKQTQPSQEVMYTQCKPQDGMYVAVINGVPCMLVTSLGLEEYTWGILLINGITHGNGYSVGLGSSFDKAMEYAMERGYDVFLFKNHKELAEWLLTV